MRHYAQSGNIRWISNKTIQNVITLVPRVHSELVKARCWKVNSAENFRFCLLDVLFINIFKSTNKHFISLFLNWCWKSTIRTFGCCLVSCSIDMGDGSGMEKPTIVGPKTLAKLVISILQCGLLATLEKENGVWIFISKGNKNWLLYSTTQVWRHLAS